MTELTKRTDGPVAMAAVAPVSYQAKPTTGLAKYEVSRVSSEYRRRKAAFQAGTVLTYEGAVAIAGLHSAINHITVPVMADMAYRASRYEGKPGGDTIAYFSQLQAEQFGAHQLRHLDRGVGAITEITTNSFDLDEDERGWISRKFGGQRR